MTRCVQTFGLYSESSTLEESNFILAFCPLVSRIGTDIDAALGKIPESKPVILVLMHHTFDPDYVVPDSRRFVEGRDIYLVDCLFYEDQGLLECSRNHVAHQNILQKIQVWLFSS
uniref:Uncharacterized protein n=1 Tax=Denticeps clupeoides TaxID=299321 RepID=A0AAY4CGG6_9TELE